MTRRSDQTDHDLDRLHPTLPLGDAAQNLYSINLAQESCPR